MRYWLKRCPKCMGDLREEMDSFGSYVSCMQCGHILSHTEEAALMTTGVVHEALPREEAPQPVRERLARRRRGL